MELPRHRQRILSLEYHRLNMWPVTDKADSKPRQQKVLEELRSATLKHTEIVTQSQKHFRDLKVVAHA
jgi:hypothetical protein